MFQEIVASMFHEVLLALVLTTHARRRARFDAEGLPVPVLVGAQRAAPTGGKAWVGVRGAAARLGV